MQVIFEVFYLVVCYGVARLLLPLLTLGRVRVEAIDRRPFTFQWHGMHRQPDGIILIHRDLASILGLILIVLLGLAAVIIWGRLDAA